MATTSSNGTRKGRSSRDLSKADATKLNASELPKLVVGYRDDKVTPSKAVNALNRKVVTILDAPGMSPTSVSLLSRPLSRLRSRMQLHPSSVLPSVRTS